MVIKMLKINFSWGGGDSAPLALGPPPGLCPATAVGLEQLPDPQLIFPISTERVVFPPKLRLIPAELPFTENTLLNHLFLF
jgi:hypothetical protein